MGLKFSNTIGAPFRSFVTDQLTTRTIVAVKENRTLEDILYLANKTAWVRLQSSVTVDNDYYKLLKGYFDDREPGTNYAVVLPNQGNISTEAARNWILQSGTSKINANGTDVTLRYGLGPDGAYGLGGTMDMGYRPMPGLDNVTVETAGKQGSLRYATINFKVWNMTQLDVIDALYFRLGFTMLLEWGHVEYLTNDKKIQRDVTGISNFFKDKVTKEDIQVQINKKVRDSCGNYDGMLGTVSNFNYSMNQDGGWDCSIKLVGLGTLLDTQRINSSYNMPKTMANLFKNLLKSYDAENAARFKALEAKINAAAAATAKDNYDAALVKYNAAHPLKNLSDYYYYRVTFNETSKKGTVLEYNNPTHINDLASSTILTPTTPTQAPTQKSSNDPIVYPLNTVTANDSKTETAFEVIVDQKTKGKALYFPWTKSTAAYGGDKAGWLYPVQVGSIYNIRTDAINYFIPTYRNSYNSNRTITMFELLNAKRNGATATRVSVQTYVGDWNNGTGQRTDNFIVEGFTINYGTTTLAPTPAPGPPPPNTGTFTPFASPATGGTTSEVTQMVTANQSGVKSYANTMYLSSEVKTGLSTSNREVYLDRVDINSKLEAVIDRIFNSTEQTPEDRAYEVKSLGTKESFNKKATFFNGSSLANRMSYLDKFQITKRIIVEGVSWYKDATAAAVEKDKINITFTLVIETQIPFLLEELVKPSTGLEVPGYKAPDSVASTQPPKTEVSQDDGLRACSSALEAILLLIQYTAIVDKKKKFKFDTDGLTAQILAAVKGAPLNRLFEKDKLRADYRNDIKTPSENYYYTDPYYLGLKGNNTALMSDQVNNGVASIDAYKEVPTVDFSNIMKAYILEKEYKNTESGLGITTELRPVYVPLGYLLFFISNICLLFDSTKPSSGDNTAARPFFYIDFNPDTNFCLTTPYQLSTNPEVCLIPYSGKNEDYNNIFKRNGVDPLTVTLKGGLFKPEGSAISSKIQVSHKYVDGVDKDNRYRGRTMDILMNTQYLLNTLKDLVQRDGSSDVYFRPFINKIIEDVNKALGGINAFRLAYIDESNTAAIVDDQYVPPSVGEPNLLRFVEENTQTSKGTSIIPIFDKMSNVRSFELQTNVSSRMSSIIAIGARDTNDGTGATANGSAQSTDGSPFSWLSKGLKDRIIQEAEDISNVVATTSGSQRINTKKNNVTIAENFNTFIKSIYGSTSDNKIDRAGADPMTNYYMQATIKQKAIDPTTSGAPIIPLNASFSTDGISGMNMGNVFLLPEKNLPISLRSSDGKTPKFGYMVMGLNHQIQANQWITNVRGQIIRLRPKSEQYLGSTFNPSNVPNKSNAPTDPSLRVGLSQPADSNKIGVPGVNVKYDVGNNRGAGLDYGTKGTPQTPVGTPMSTANFGKNSANKKYYPKFEFKGFTDHTSDIPVTSPLTEAEIIDKTNQNPFNFGLFGNGTGKAEHFMVHHVGGIGDTIQTFLARGFPTQYIIDQLGVIYRYIPDGAMGQHTKNANTAFGKSEGVTNLNTVGVEIVSEGDFDITEAQVEACMRLINYCGFNADQVVGHGEIDSVKDCWEGYLITTRIRNSAANWNLSKTACGSDPIRRLKQ